MYDGDDNDGGSCKISHPFSCTSFIENENKKLQKVRTLSLIKILWVVIKKCNAQGFSTKFMQIYAGLGF